MLKKLKIISMFLLLTMVLAGCQALTNQNKVTPKIKQDLKTIQKSSTTVDDQKPSPAVEPCITGQICITSPKEGDVVMAGQTITVNIEPAAGVVLKEVFAIFHPEDLSIPDTDIIYPFQESVKVPKDKLGPAKLKALAKDKDGNIFETSIGLIVDTNEHLIELRVNSYPDFHKAGEKESFWVSGVFSDGTTKNISVAPKINYVSTNPKVVTINKIGDDAIVEAIDLGTSVIIVTYGDFKKIVRAHVGVGETRGDMNWDNWVGQDDVDLLVAAKGKQSTGSDDPRDLDLDGQITSIDEEQLKLLCSRPNCVAITDKSNR